MKRCSVLISVEILLCLYCSLIVDDVQALSPHSAVTITNNGYKNILIAIHPKMKEDSSLLNSIKEMMVESSKYLYAATEKRAYLSDVTILIPNSWTNNFSWIPAKSELYSNADIVVESANKSSTVSQSGSYTQTYGGCGIPGVRIHLFTDIFDVHNGDTYGPARSHIFVHEWAHYRWGVFDESAVEGEQMFYFSPTTRQSEAVRCNLHLTGKVSSVTLSSQMWKFGFLRDEVYNYVHREYNGSELPCLAQNASLEHCVFHPDTNSLQNENVSASIMNQIITPSITHFCNAIKSDVGKVHNYEAPSQHNRICGGKSTWTVISESAGMDSLLPSEWLRLEEVVTLLEPFAVKTDILQSDTQSLSTIIPSLANDKLMKTRQAITTFIEDVIVDGTELGIISFSGKSDLIVPITKISSNAERLMVVSKLPTKCAGETNIGNSLLTSIEVLEAHTSQSHDTFIVVITDGSDTSGSNMDDITEKLKEAGAVVSIISFSNDENKDLESITKNTGGRYFYSSFKSVTALEALVDIYTLLTAELIKTPVLILSQGKFLDSSDSLQGSFFINSNLGNNTRITLTYTTDKPPDIVIFSPTGRRYCSIYPEYYEDVSLRRVKFTIPALAEAGQWKYKVTNENGSRTSVYLVVTSALKDPGSETFKLSGSIIIENTTESILSVVVAEIKEGNQPVKKLKVRAIVSRPMADPVELELLDNGVGADIIKDDGIYSRFFTSFTISGRYSAIVEMADSRGDIIITESLNGQPQIARSYAGSVHIEHAKLPSEQLSSLVLVDNFPPMRITDLRVLHTHQTNGIIVLAWTAPGDDGDHDRASFYKIVLSHDAETLIDVVELPVIDESFVVKGTLNSPQPFGMTEKVTLEMKSYLKQNASFVFAVFAVDESGNKGKMSNLVTVGFGYVPDIVTQEYLNYFLSDETHYVKVAPDEQKVAIASVVGLAAGLLLVTIVVTLVVHYVTVKKAGLQESKFFSKAKNLPV
ncbi:Calcium-activated chloride channel regulator 1 [Bulinus truncatus]|nr:Calcium-activated chloride channel regulator 1 [Bulinus truncatus]